MEKLAQLLHCILLLPQAQHPVLDVNLESGSFLFGSFRFRHQAQVLAHTVVQVGRSNRYALHQHCLRPLLCRNRCPLQHEVLIVEVIPLSRPLPKGLIRPVCVSFLSIVA